MNIDDYYNEENCLISLLIFENIVNTYCNRKGKNTEKAKIRDVMRPNTGNLKHVTRLQKWDLKIIFVRQLISPAVSTH